jgi:hypothetical protein
MFQVVKAGIIGREWRRRWVSSLVRERKERHVIQAGEADPSAVLVSGRHRLNSPTNVRLSVCQGGACLVSFIWMWELYADSRQL